MGLGLQAVADLVDGPPPAVTLVERIRAEVTTAVAEIRRIIDDLRPSVLDTAGLAAAVSRHAEAISAALPVAVDTTGLIDSSGTGTVVTAILPLEPATLYAG